jgi:hypothetical protein
MRTQPAPRGLVSRWRHAAQRVARRARQLGLQTFALWRLGEEDNSLWNVWDKPEPRFASGAECVQPGHDVDTEGDGDIMRVTGLPQPGKRTVTSTPTSRSAQEAHHRRAHGCVSPHLHHQQYGYHPNEVALSFDDGPDPKWTPKILDILKAKNAKGTFMLIGAEAAENMGVMQRGARRPRDRQPHLHASRHQRNLAAPA